MTIAKITGSTYEYRDLLKAAGATWDAGEKCWTMPMESWERFLERHGHGINKKDKARAQAVRGWEVEAVETC